MTGAPRHRTAAAVLAVLSMLFTVAVAVSLGSSALPAQASVVSMHSSARASAAVSADGKSPSGTGCTRSATTIETHRLAQGRHRSQVRVDLRFSPTCHTVWARIRGGHPGCYAAIMTVDRATRFNAGVSAPGRRAWTAMLAARPGRRIFAYAQCGAGATAWHAQSAPFNSTHYRPSHPQTRQPRGSNGRDQAGAGAPKLKRSHHGGPHRGPHPGRQGPIAIPYGKSLCGSDEPIVSVTFLREPEGLKIQVEPRGLTRWVGRYEARDIWDAIWWCHGQPPLTNDQKESLYKQLVCHVENDHPRSSGWATGPTYGLDTWRANIPWSKVLNVWNVARHQCNW